MHTHMLLQPARLPAPAGPSPGTSTVREQVLSWWTPKHTILATALGAGIGIVALFITRWAGWPGLAGLCAGLALISLAVAFVQHAREVRVRNELIRFVAGLQRQDSNRLAWTSNLPADCKEIGQAILATQESLLRELNEKQAAIQKLELSHSLAHVAQRRAESILDGLSEALLITNSFGELILANSEAQSLLRFALDKVRGKNVRQVLDVPALVQMIEQVTQRGSGGGIHRHNDELTLTIGGKPLSFKVQVGPALDPTTSEPLGIITMLRDVTLEKAAQARSAEFVSAVSHEIKTPLASVKAYAEMLADGDADGDPETQQKFLNIIEVQTDRMSRLLESMLDIARIESGVVRVEKKLASLNELIEGGAKLMAPAAAEKNLAVDLRLSSLYLGVHVDPDMLSRVVMNLFSNAIKYTEPGGHITLRSQFSDDQAIFEVEDTGRGIPADALPKLFQKFYRVKENSNAAAGTGLGLSLVRHIVEEVHGGKVEVESEVGKGSTFRVRLPLERLN